MRRWTALAAAAMPLLLDESGAIDWRAQRAVVRYYLAVATKPSGSSSATPDQAAAAAFRTVLGDAAQLKRARDIFSRATLRAARNWTFTPPRRGLKRRSHH